MTYAEFIKKYNGKGTDFDGRYDVQCVDLAKVYLKEVFGITAGYWGDAYAYYDNFSAHSELTSNFTRIANTPDFIPQKGDIVVWSSSLSSNGCGHIAIANGEGTTTYFYSYDQNWTGNHDKCKLVKHNYNHVLGVLRPKDQSKITGGKVLDKTGSKLNDRNTQSFAIKRLLQIAYLLKIVSVCPTNDGLFGKTTEKAVNQLLKKWGYKENGIAGTQFINKLSNEIKNKVR